MNKLKRKNIYSIVFIIVFFSVSYVVRALYSKNSVAYNIDNRIPPGGLHSYR